MCAHTLKTKECAHIVGMRQVGLRSIYKNKEEMRQTVQGVWDQVSLEQLQMLISSMPNKMQQIISTKDGSTRW
jgi:phage-related protein